MRLGVQLLLIRSWKRCAFKTKVRDSPDHKQINIFGKETYSGM